MARVRIEPGGKVLIAVVIFGALLFLFFKIKGTQSTLIQTTPPPVSVTTSSQNVATQPPPSKVTSQKISEESQRPEETKSARGPIRIFFDFNRASINKNVYCIFDRIEEAARRDGSRNVKVVVEGNADSIGPRWYNIYLSKMRAARVADSLSKRLGIPLKSIELVANGSIKPVASNTTREGRAENRRTEIYIYR